MSKAIDKAYSRIRDGIISGELSPGQHLKEEELAELCQVSRTPIRDALRRLEADYFVERHDNQRVFVAAWTEGDIDDIFELRAMLEGFAAARAARYITLDQIAQMRSHHTAIQAAVTDDGRIDEDLFLGHNRAFHKIILDAAQSTRLAIMLQRLVEQPVVLRTLVSYREKDLARSIGQHDEILDALTAHDGVWANAVMTSHIHHAQRVYRRAAAKEAVKQAAE
ncbi:MAG: GntR family transcriptional regulator [Pseudomonadota bacterium]